MYFSLIFLLSSIVAFCLHLKMLPQLPVFGINQENTYLFRIRKEHTRNKLAETVGTALTKGILKHMFFNIESAGTAVQMQFGAEPLYHPASWQGYICGIGEKHVEHTGLWQHHAFRNCLERVFRACCLTVYIYSCYCLMVLDSFKNT